MSSVGVSSRRSTGHGRERYEWPVTDVLFVAIVLGFFALAVLFVRACQLVLAPREVGEREP